MNETLTPDDAGKILEELLDAQNHAHLLGLMMNIKPSDVEAIEAMYHKPKDRLLHIIIAFLNQSQPTWRTIINALRTQTVNLPRLAASVEAAHFPDTTATRHEVAETTGMSPSAPLISDWCSHVSIISDTESVANSTDSDDEVKSKTPSQPSPATGKLTIFSNI